MEVEVDDDPSQPPMLEFRLPDGRSAMIDIRDGALTYTGEIPVDESARMFFEHFGNLSRRYYLGYEPEMRDLYDH